MGILKKQGPLNPNARKPGTVPSREEVAIAVSTAWVAATESRNGLKKVEIGGISYTVHDTDKINEVVAQVLNRINSHPS